LFVENPLVQGVLVDDRYALLGFGDEVAVVDLQGGVGACCCWGGSCTADSVGRPRAIDAAKV
jgi:hypothetical protein